MTSIKLKFRPSTTPGKEGSIVFQLIYGRTVRRITSRYKIFAGEWNGEVGRIALPTSSSPRYAHLVSVESALQWELNRLQRMVQESVPVNLDEIAANFSSGIGTMDSVFNFIRRQIHHKEQIGKVRSSETYRSMLNSFTCFRKGVDLTFDMMDGMLMELYEAWMRKCGLTRNSTFFYMRILRTNYKLAVEKGLTPDRHPFRKVYCGIDKTVKRSLPFSEIKKISALDLSRKPSMDFARDMFMFSFCTRGMSFIDMAYLKKADLVLLTEKWMPCVPFMRVLCIGHCMTVLSAANIQAVNAVGRSDITLKLEFIKKPFYVVAICFAMFISPFAIAVANVLYGFVGVLLNTWPNKKLVNYKFAEQLSDIRPQLLLSLAVAAVAYLVGLFEMNCYLLLGIQLVVGFGLYWLASKKLSLESYTYIVSTVKSFRNKNS